MSNHTKTYEVLAESLTAQGLDIEAIKSALKAQQIETPSWGYANSGTRFKAFPWWDVVAFAHECERLHQLSGRM